MTDRRQPGQLEGLRAWGQRAVVTLLTALFIIYVLQWPTNYLILRPGQALDVGPMIAVEGEMGAPSGLLMTTVMTSRANLWLAVIGAVHPGIEMYHLSRFMRPGQTVEEYYQQNQWLMSDSQALATTLALQKLGYEAYTIGDGALVTYVLPGAPAHGILRAGDIIITCQGLEVQTGEALLESLQDIDAGELVSLRYLRQEQLEEVELGSEQHPDDDRRAFIGITVLTAHPMVVGPQRVEIDAGEVGGPSAGLIFTLEIINRHRGDLIPPGMVVAGTGILDRNANVSAVGGIKHKVRAAEEMGADVFLAPAANYQEALQAARSMRVIAIDSLDHALEEMAALDKVE